MKGAIIVKKDSSDNEYLNKLLQNIHEFKYFKPSLFLEINSNKIYFFKLNLVKINDFKNSEEFHAINDFIENLKTNPFDNQNDPNAFLKYKSFGSIEELDFAKGNNIKNTEYPSSKENFDNMKTCYKNLDHNNFENFRITYKNHEMDNLKNGSEMLYSSNICDYCDENKKIDIHNTSNHRNEIKINKINAYYCGILKGDLEKTFSELFNCNLIKTGHINQLTILGLDYIFCNIEKSFFYLPGQKVSNLVKVGKLEEVTQKTYTNINEEFYPFVMANILEGISVYKVESIEKFSRIGGSIFGASSYWSLVSMICGYDDPEKAVEDAIKGNNELIDLSVGDIYGGGYGTFNLDSSLIASSFGKIKYINDLSEIDKKDISRSLMTLMCVSASQICAFLAKQENIKNIIIVGNSFESLEFMQMVQMCVGYFSEDKCRAYFSQYSPFINLIGMIMHLDL